MSRLTVLSPYPLPQGVIDKLETHVDLVRLWEARDRDAAMAECAERVGAIAVAGHDVPTGPDLMGRFPHLKLVANFGVGYDHIDAAWAGRHGIVVTNTPGVLDDEVADTALGLTLMAVRQFPAAERHLRAGHWIRDKFPLSASLRGRTMGILGFGRIGKAIAKRAEAFGLTIVYHNRRPLPDEPYLYYPTATALAEASDILMVVTPGGAGTRHLVGREMLRALGPQGVLVNVARGSVVDEAALIEALRNREILSAGLDVFADEPHVPQALVDMEHVVLLPHVGSASQPTRDAMWQVMVDNIVSWGAGQGPLTPVAETPWPSRR